MAAARPVGVSGERVVRVGFLGEVQEVEPAVDFAGHPAGVAGGERAAVLVRHPSPVRMSATTGDP